MWLENFWHLFCFVECCSKYWIPNNITDLDVRFQRQLFGQPLAHNLILRSISSHLSMANPSKALVLSLHGSTGTGKNFVVKHLVESLYGQGYRSKFVRFYVVSRDFMHNDADNIRQYKDRLTSDIEEATRSCAQSTFIFDEIDLMPKQVLDVILYYIDFHTPTSAQPIDFRRTIFIFLSNTGGQSIIDLTMKFHRSSISREQFNIRQFQEILSNASFHEQGGLWHSPLIERSLVTFFVPFLPLEPQHVRHCIDQHLQILLEQDPYDYHLSKKDIIERVLDLIEMNSSSSFVYSVSGCKKVQQKLNYVFESLRPELEKTLKKKDIFADQL